jgi:alanine racemase
MISLYDILEAANGQLFGEPGPHLFSDFCVDSRRAEESNLYVAVKTERGDGHQFVREAVERGATGILCTRPPEFDTEGLSIIIVKDPLTALMNWSHYILGKLGVQVIGVGGLVTKTVTTEAIRMVLSTRFNVLSGAHVGDETVGSLKIPLTLSNLTPEHHVAVLELDALQPGDMGEIVGAVRPHIGVITQLGYIDSFDTSEQVAEENALLMNYLSPTGLAVLNYDDDRVRALAARTRAQVATVGSEVFGADLAAYNVVVGPTGTGFDVRYEGGRHVGRWTPLLGKHQLYSILAALAVGIYYDVPMNDALRAITEMQPLPGRMKPLNGVNGCLLVDDSYSADPQSSLAALDWLQSVTDEQHRAIFVMGDMDSLGVTSQRNHRMIGQRASEFVSLFITEGTDAALAGRAALDQGMDPRTVRITYSIQDAVGFLTNGAGLTSSDVVLIKGSSSARMELVAQAVLADPTATADLPRQQLLSVSEHYLRPLRPSWVEVDLDVLANNVRLLKEQIGSEVMLIAVVKADAYGHGAVAVARTALLNGAEYLAVANMGEAVELRDAGIDAPILVLSYTPTQAIRQAVRQNITVTLYDLDLARAYDRAAREAGGKLLAHIKLDTGMGRLGILAADAVPFFRHMLKLSNIEVEGVYTHFSMADENPVYTNIQTRVFRDTLAPLRASGFNFKYVHAANSAATLASPESHFNAVRVGLAMYGLDPSETLRLPEQFEPVLAWKTIVGQVKTLPPGHPVGYGNTYLTRTEERIAILPMGYADGFRRAPHNWGQVLVHGQFAPVIGRVSMEKTTISVSHIPDVSVGDEVVLLGQQGPNRITAEEIAHRLGTINYEVVTSILPRVSRR